MSVDVSTHDRIAWVHLDHGPVNALDLELCEDISDTITQLDSSDDVAAIVLTAAGSSFSAGVDLQRILDEPADYIDAFLDALTRCFLTVFRTARPTVAAVNGHAIAGGCVLAGACDRAIAADTAGRIGLTELAVGVPFPTAALEIIRRRTARHIDELTLHADTYRPPQALERGLIDEVVPAQDLTARATATAAALARVPSPTYKLTKQQLHHHAEAAIATSTPTIDPLVRQRWKDDETRTAINAYMASLRGRQQATQEP